MGPLNRSEIKEKEKRRFRRNSPKDREQAKQMVSWEPRDENIPRKRERMINLNKCW